jgi:predicted aldo/keto reductase-like oxidoreductase
MEIAKRELGRTRLQVTTLGYGAMELRGAPRARDISEAQAETILNKVLDASINYIDASINYIDTSVDYVLSEERIGHYISHRRAEYYWPANAVVWSARPRLRAANGGLTSSLLKTSWRGLNKA